MRFSFFRHTRWTAFLTAGAIAACNTAPLVGIFPKRASAELTPRLQKIAYLLAAKALSRDR